MDIIIVPLFNLIEFVLRFYISLVMAYVILGWLTAFGIINSYNRLVAIVSEFLHRIIEPVLQPIRSVLPNLGNLDISPLILIMLLYFIKDIIERISLKLMGLY